MGRPAAEVVVEIDVSVVIATYCSPEDGLRRVVESLDAQTLDPGRFEVIFVDDGSPDDTVTRLHTLARTRPHVRVLQVPHSGWACEPRNAGIEAAQGHYVFFMDHDDSLFGDALERGSEFGRRNGSDIVNCRELRSSGIGWAWDVYTEDLARPDKHLLTLQPMLPHKFYRRQLLLDGDIRFPVGGRVLWEDNYFNVAAYARAEVISVLSSVPSYVWQVDTGSNTYDTFESDPGQYWSQLERLFEFFADTLAGADDLDWIRRRTYQLRVLGLWAGPAALQRSPEERAHAYAAARRLAVEHVPVRLDDGLPQQARAWSHLLRSQQYEALGRLAGVERGTSAIGTADRFGWTARGLKIEASATWHRPTENTSAGPSTEALFRREGDRLVRVLPAELDQALPLDILDVAADLDRASGVVTYHRRGGVQAEVGVATDDRLLERTDVGGRTSIGHQVTAELDLDANTFGHRLEEATYDFSLRVAFMGHVAHRRLRSTQTSRTALVRGRVALAYSDRAGFLALQISRSVGRVLTESTPQWWAASLERGSRGRSRLLLPIAGLAAVGETELACSLVLTPIADDEPPTVVPGVIVGAGGRTWLSADLSASVGRYRLGVEDEAGRNWSTDRQVRVHRARRVSIEPDDTRPDASTAPTWGQ